MNKLKQFFSSRKNEKFFLYIQLVIALLMIPLIVFNLPLFFGFVSVGGIIYFLIDVVEIFKQEKVLTNNYLKAYLFLSAIYLIAAIVVGVKDIEYLLVCVGIIAAGFYLFKLYYVIIKGLFNKKIELKLGTIIFLVGIGLSGASYFVLPIDLFAVIVVSLGLVYVIMYWLVRLILDRSDRNREI